MKNSLSTAEELYCCAIMKLGLVGDMRKYTEICENIKQLSFSSRTEGTISALSGRCRYMQLFFKYNVLILVHVSVILF